jgi:hypothetical protein
MSIYAGRFRKFITKEEKAVQYFFSIQGRYEKNYTIDQLFLPDFTPVVDGKLACRAFDEKNHTLLIYNTFFYVKKGFPTG